MSDLIIQIEILQNLLISAATGGNSDNEEFQKLRKIVLENQLEELPYLSGASPVKVTGPEPGTPRARGAGHRQPSFTGTKMRSPSRWISSATDFWALATAARTWSMLVTGVPLTALASAPARTTRVRSTAAVNFAT